MLDSGSGPVASTLLVRLFGPFEVQVDGQPLPRLRSHTGAGILALLTLRRGGEVERTWLAGTLWPDSSERQALANLRVTLRDLRRALGPEARRLRSPTPRTLLLDLRNADADLPAFDAAIAREDRSSLEEAVRLYRGPLLEGWTEEWLFQERRTREEVYLSALERLAAEAMGQGDVGEAARWLRLAVAADPLRESAHRALMQALAASGNYAAAVEGYRELRLLLHRELNTEPDAETRELFEAIRAEARRKAGVRRQSPDAGPDTVDADRASLSSELAPGVWRLMPGTVALHYRHDAQPDAEVFAFLERELAGHGYTVFVDRRPTIGVEWAEEIERQVRQAEAVILLLSRASVESEMFAYEVEMAHAAQQQHARPRLIPVRVRYAGPLPAPLASILDPLDCPRWTGPEDNPRLLAELLHALQSEPAPIRSHFSSSPVHAPVYGGALPSPSARSTLALEQALLGGAMPLDSEFYVVRSTDAAFHAAIARQDSLVLLKGARQMGKTSLLGRALHRARQAGARVLLTDFQALNAAHLESVEALFLTLAEWLADDLDLEVSPEQVWNPRRGASKNFEWYLRREVLGKLSAPLVWGIDEVDRLFPCDFGSEVFGLFRSWHNRRLFEPDGPWKRLTLAMAYATEAHLFITDLNQSPFNVGTLLALEDFTLEQVADLNRRCGAPLKDAAEIARFYDLVSGQPYLVSRGLAEMAAHGTGIDVLEAQADRDEGIFRDHLRRLLVSLARDAELCDAVRGVLQGKPCPTPESFYRLRSAGVLAGDSPRDARPRCRLYAAYLNRYLGRSSS